MLGVQLIGLEGARASSWSSLVSDLYMYITRALSEGFKRVIRILQAALITLFIFILMIALRVALVAVLA